MTLQSPKTVALGELVIAVYEEAAEYSADPLEVSRLATQTLSHMLVYTPKSTTSPALVSKVS